jgi:hypothetical protein
MCQLDSRTCTTAPTGARVHHAPPHEERGVLNGVHAELDAVVVLLLVVAAAASTAALSTFGFFPVYPWKRGGPVVHGLARCGDGSGGLLGGGGDVLQRGQHPRREGFFGGGGG